MLLAPVLGVLLTLASALVAIPDEPGAEVVVEASIVQAIAADLDGDGLREILALVAGDGPTVRVEGWRDGPDGWEPMRTPVVVAAPSNDPRVTWTGTPLRLVVRRVAGGERVTLVRQPEFRDEKAAVGCCLVLDDIVAEGDRLRIVQAAPRAGSVDAVWAVDLDGDAVDEVVATRSLPPLGGISFPTEVVVHRWVGDRFAVTESRLEIGSGDTPFPLGDTDGRPGDELGLIATLGRPALYRLRPDGQDAMVAEDAGIVADAAAAVPTSGEGRGVAVLGGGTLTVRPWPAGQPVGPPLAEVPMGEATIIGTVELSGTPSILLRQVVGGDRVHALGLPNLTPPRFGAITRSPAAAAFGSGPVEPYVGPVPGGGLDGKPALVYGGRLLASSPPMTPEPFTGLRFAAMAGAQAIGLVGPGRGNLALVHAARPLAAGDPRGGKLEAPRIEGAVAVTVAPFASALDPELDDAAFDPPTTDAIQLGASLGVSASGFSVTVAAPAGSRVYVGGLDPSVTDRVLAVPPSGTLDVPMVRADLILPAPRFRASLGVVTPSGHSYLATWDVRVRGAPTLEVSVVTFLGMGDVQVAGRSEPYASVTVAGTSVPVDGDGRFVAARPLPPWPTELVVTSTDPFGVTTTATVTGVGWFDYRALPWIPIVAAGVALAGAVLFVRVPRVRPQPRRADDDAALEELEPD